MKFLDEATRETRVSLLLALQHRYSSWRVTRNGKKTRERRLAQIQKWSFRSSFLLTRSEIVATLTRKPLSLLFLLIAAIRECILDMIGPPRMPLLLLLRAWMRVPRIDGDIHGFGTVPCTCRGRAGTREVSRDTRPQPDVFSWRFLRRDTSLRSEQDSWWVLFDLYLCIERLLPRASGSSRRIWERISRRFSEKFEKGRCCASWNWRGSYISIFNWVNNDSSRKLMVHQTTPSLNYYLFCWLHMYNR